MPSTHIALHHATVTRQRREGQNTHKSRVLWFTGLSGSGKSTLAHTLEEYLHQKGYRTFVLDGDHIRHGLSGDLGFSAADRHENMRRIGEVVKLFTEAGMVVLTAFISPFRADRQQVKKIIGASDFVEIHCKCSLEVCEQRDTKGLYKKARAGLIKDFTGISSPYEEPEKADLVIDTSSYTVEESLAFCVEFLGFDHHMGHEIHACEHEIIH